MRTDDRVSKPAWCRYRRPSERNAQAVRVAIRSAKATSASLDRTVAGARRAALASAGQAEDVGTGLGPWRGGRAAGRAPRRAGRRRSAPGQQLAQPGVLGSGRAPAREHRQRGDALAQVGPGRLAGLARESLAMSRMSSESWKATPTFSPYAVSARRPPRARAGEHRAVARRGGDQRAGLARRRRAGSAPARPRRWPAAGSRGSGPRPAGENVSAWIRTASGAERRRSAPRTSRTASRRPGSRRGCPSGRWPTRRRGAAAASSITSSW